MDIKIEEMTTADKLRAMEVLWDDMCRNYTQINSPQWHEELLRARETSLELGNDSFIDWQQAKAELMDLD